MHIFLLPVELKILMAAYGDYQNMFNTNCNTVLTKLEWKRLLKAYVSFFRELKFYPQHYMCLTEIYGYGCVCVCLGWQVG